MLDIALPIARENSLRARTAREREHFDENAVDVAFARRAGSCGSRIRTM